MDPSRSVKSLDSVKTPAETKHVIHKDRLSTSEVDSHPSVLFTFVRRAIRSRDSSVGIALGYGLDDRGSRVRFPAEAGNFSLHHRVQNGSGAHPASYPMGTRSSFTGGKAAGA
jgi:hypothetical protein